MAGMALQCVKNAGFHVHSATELNAALANTKQKLLASRGANGHIGNEFSTGLAVQVSIYFLLFAEFHIYFYCLKRSRKTWMLKSTCVMCFRLYWRWEALKQSTLLQLRQWGQVSDATRIATRWPCLRFYQLFTWSPTWPLKISSVCLRMVCGCYIATLWPTYVMSVCKYCNCVFCWGVFCRHSGAGAQRSHGGITNWDQSEPKGGSCHIQRSNCSLFCGCA